MRNCCAKGCPAKIVNARFFCEKHWTMVPSSLQTRLADEWRPNNAYSIKLNNALTEAIVAVKAAENVQQ